MVWTLVRSMVVLVITIEFVVQRVLQALDRLFEGAFGAHHFIVDLFITGFNGDLHMVESRVHELFAHNADRTSGAHWC